MLLFFIVVIEKKNKEPTVEDEEGGIGNDNEDDRIEKGPEQEILNKKEPELIDDKKEKTGLF